MDNNIIQITNLKKNYDNQRVVDIKQLTVKQGEIYGFLGPNGAGKSTTMKMLLSLVPLDSGEIKILGNSIDNSLEYLEDIGSMIEEPSYYPNLTGYENLMVLQRMLKFDISNIKYTLDLVGLNKKENRKKLVKSYSLGMKQRLALAFALVKKPKILILDEPTNGLDPSGIHEIRELIIKLAKDLGITILISSHILYEIEQLADRVGIISNGRLVYEGEISQIKANEWIELEGEFNTNIVDKLSFSDYSIQLLNVEENILRIKGTNNVILAHLIKELVFDGNYIYRVERKKESLETIFLNLTKEEY